MGANVTPITRMPAASPMARLSPIPQMVLALVFTGTASRVAAVAGSQIRTVWSAEAEASGPAWPL